MTEMLETDAPEAAGEIAQIEAIMASDPASYWSGDLPDRYRELLEARERGETTPACGGPAAEIRSLERMLSTPEGYEAYWRSQEAQDRYRQLLGEQEEAPVEQAVEHVALPTLSDVLREHPDADPEVIMGRRNVASDVLIAIDDPGDAAVTRALFDALDPRVATAVLDAVADPTELASEPATDAEVAEFGTWAGTLAREWGSDAGYRLGVVEARLARVIAASGQDWFDKWLLALPEPAFAAILRRLAQ